jgi:hypothetical protein
MREAMRNFCAAALAASLILVSAASAEPLAPGKPAGIREARLHAGTGLLIIGGLLVAGIVVAAANTGGNNNTGIVTPPVSTVTTS